MVIFFDTTDMESEQALKISEALRTQASRFDTFLELEAQLC
jgi:hypothetical protein